MRRLALVHAAANALLLWLSYYWLGIGETQAATLIWSFTVALVVIAAACCTYGAPLVYFRSERGSGVMEAWRRALRNLPALAMAALAVLAIYVLLAQVRGPSKPPSAVRAFQAAWFVLRWVILPALLLPVMGAVATHGWRGFLRPRALRRPWSYWVAAPLLVLGCLWLPWKLVGWVPRVNGFWLETTSFFVRALAAYLLFVAGWLGLAFVTSGGNPRFTQERTAASP